MSDINNNEQSSSIWPTSNPNNIKPNVSASQNKESAEVSNATDKEITRRSLDGSMDAVSGRSLIKSKSSFKGFEDKNSGIKITPERLATVTEDMKPFLRASHSSVMRASALGDFAYEKAVKENLTDPMAKAAIIQFAAEKEFEDSSV